MRKELKHVYEFETTTEKKIQKVTLELKWPIIILIVVVITSMILTITF